MRTITKALAPPALRAAVLALGLLLAAGTPAAAQEAGPLAPSHLEQALDVDAAHRALLAQRDAIAARFATVRSPIAGSPFLGGGFRADTRGFNEARELDLEFAAPMWLPGQRGALGDTVSAGVAETEARLVERRLEVAGLLREAWWAVALAERAARLARDRVATARDIARDVTRRAELGDLPPSDALLPQGETLAAELALVQAEAEAEAARAAYRTLTGGLEPPPSGPVPRATRATPHPRLRAAELGLATAEARQRLVAATPRDNPELGLFGRSQDGNVTEQGVSLGVRLRFPLATEARNAPRRAEAEADVTRAAAELAQRRRILDASIAAAQAALRAAEGSERIARQRLAVAGQQLDAARRAFRAGETGTFELFRARQIQLEAAEAEARASVAAGRARSRLNQAVGAMP